MERKDRKFVSEYVFSLPGPAFAKASDGQARMPCQSALADHALPGEVARTIGCKNPNHFSTAFKKKFGVNPSVYRVG